MKGEEAGRNSQRASAKNAIGENNTGSWRAPGCGHSVQILELNSLRPAEGGNRKATGRLEHPVGTFSKPDQAYAISGSADCELANDLAHRSSSALLSREVGRGQLQLAVPSERKLEEGKERPSEQAADSRWCWAPARKVPGIRDLVLSLLE